MSEAIVYNYSSLVMCNAQKTAAKQNIQYIGYAMKVTEVNNVNVVILCTVVDTRKMKQYYQHVLQT